MKLLTKAIERKIPALYSTEEVETQDKTIVCKFFALGSGWTWYVVEGERQEWWGLPVLWSSPWPRERVGILLTWGT